MKLRFLQKNINNADWFGMLAKHESPEVDLLCLGELATSGCLYHLRSFEDADSVIGKLATISTPVMLGLPRNSENGRHNSFLFYEKGEIQFYNKRNLFPPMNEDKVYVPGHEPAIFETGVGRIGVAICYDLRFPKVFDDLKAGGAEMIFVPAAFPRVRVDDWRRLLAERADQTGLPVVGINAVGDDGTNEFGGSTMMVRPGGEIVAQLDETSETYLDIEIENEALASGNLQIRTEHEQGSA